MTYCHKSAHGMVSELISALRPLILIFALLYYNLNECLIF